MLFLGDLENDENDKTSDVYGQLLTRYGIYLKSDVIMLPHHGAGSNGNSDNQAFYKTVGAKIGIISSYVAYRHLHPKIEALNSFCGNKLQTCTLGKEL